MNTKKILSFFLKVWKDYIYWIFIISLIWLTYVYAVQGGDTLTSSMWNNLLSQVSSNSSWINSLDSRLTAVETAQESPIFTCTEEFDFIETWVWILSYTPSLSKRAELMTNWFICWNRTDDLQKVSPLNWYSFSNWFYSNWSSNSWWVTKICWRITSLNSHILSIWSANFYFWLSYNDWVTSTFHWRWAAWSTEGYWWVGTSDRWTIWTCK